MNCIRARNLKLWQVLLLTAMNLHPCIAMHYNIRPTSQIGDESVQMLADHGASPDDQMQVPTANSISFGQELYFYDHNETRVAMARAEAEANGGGARSSSKFPDWNPPADGCNWDNANTDLWVMDGRPWYAPTFEDSVHVRLIAVDSCAKVDEIYVRYQPFHISSKPWRIPKPDIDLVKSRSMKVLVEIRAVGLEILGEGVYYSATGKMQLVGCTRHVTSEVVVNRTEAFKYETRKLSEFEAEYTYRRWTGRGVVTLVTSSGACAMAVTLQYPPLKVRWNWQRVLKFSLRSTRDAGDPLHFDPVERNVFFPYRGDSRGPEHWQGRLATGGRILLLLLGLGCVALQIQHGRHNEEALPFASLAMLGIQIANHVSQTSIFKDLQIGRYQKMLDFKRRPTDGPTKSMMPYGKSSFPDSSAVFAYYGSMAWHEYVPYQAMTMAAIFMYVWIFHRVGDRRRIMQLRVRKGRPGAVDPPRDGQLVFATLTLFAIVGVVGIFANVVDRSSAFGEPGSLFGNTNYTAIFWELTPHAPNDEYVSPRFHELWYAQWGVVNKVTGLVVSLFLVPQLLGNWRWDVQGRPLSKWFYVGLPLLQSLPPVFAIAKHFQLLPILACFDPYLDSFYGVYENPTPWWQIAVVSSSALLVLAVHFQFATSFRPSRSYSSSTETAHAQTGDML